MQAVFLLLLLNLFADFAPGDNRNLAESLRQLWIEMRSRAAHDFTLYRVERLCCPVGAVRRERIQSIDNCEQSRAERNAFSAQSVGMAAAIEPLVMMSHNLRGWA